MHFNPENNYYITLGIPRNASQDKMRERWKRLMLLYHPDRQGGDEEWVSERAKKVNEAYSTLKDDSKKMAYDRKLMEQVLNTKSVPYPKVRTRTFSHNRSDKHAMNSRWSKTKKYLPRILVGLYIFAALIFIGFIYLQNRSSHLETELLSKQRQTSQTTVTLLEEKYESLNNVTALPDNRADKIIDNREQEIASLNNTTIKKQLKYQEQKPKEQTKKIPDITKEAKQPRKTEGSNLPESNERDREIKANILKQRAIKQSEASYNKNSQETKVLPESTNRTVGQASRLSYLETDHITKEEVEDFMQRYIKAYEKNDLNTFMSFFSKSAVENNRLNYAAIRNAYKNTFSEKINYYMLQNMAVRIEGLNAFVSGIYNINRYLSAKDRWVRYSGKIYWKLVKENNSLKIISMNYDN